MPIDKLWVAIGFIGQAVFSARFIVQWIVSERRKKSVIPVSFWFLSIAGSLVLLSYAIAPHPMDLLFTVFELVAIAIAVLSIAFIAHDGETHWMEGVQLLAVYVILALGFFFLPA